MPLVPIVIMYLHGIDPRANRPGTPSALSYVRFWEAEGQPHA